MKFDSCIFLLTSKSLTSVALLKLSQLLIIFEIQQNEYPKLEF